MNKDSLIDIRNLKAQIHKISPDSELDHMMQNVSDTITGSEFIALAPIWAKMSEIKELTAI